MAEGIEPFKDSSEIIAKSESGAPETSVSQTREPVGWGAFGAYLALWVILAVGTVVVLRPAALADGIRWTAEYGYMIWAGVAMTALGPILTVVMWLVARGRRSGEERRGLFSLALVKGAVATFTGVVLWLISLYVLDLMSSGILV